MRTRSSIVLAALLVAVAALVAAGCGGGSSSSSSGSGGGSGKLAADQTITTAGGWDPPSPAPGRATDPRSANVLLNIMDPLVKLAPKPLKPLPSLAQSWDQK